jgi:hypothetical protein
VLRNALFFRGEMERVSLSLPAWPEWRSIDWQDDFSINMTEARGVKARMAGGERHLWSRPA